LHSAKRVATKRHACPAKCGKGARKNTERQATESTDIHGSIACGKRVATKSHARTRKNTKSRRGWAIFRNIGLQTPDRIPLGGYGLTHCGILFLVMNVIKKLAGASLFFLGMLHLSAQCIDDENNAYKLQKDVRSYTGDFDTKMKFFKDEIEKNPKCFYFYALRGRTYANYDKYDLAVADFKKAEELVSLTTSKYWKFETGYYTGDKGENMKKLIEIRDRLVQSKNYIACIDLCTSVFTYKKIPDFIFSRGDCYYNTRQFESASKDFLWGIDVLGKTDIGAAKRTLDAVLLLPDIAFREKFYLLRSRARLQLKDYDGALSDCTEALRLDPKLSEANDLLAVIKSANGTKTTGGGKVQPTETQTPEVIARNKMAKENPELYKAYSEAIENKNYQYISRILANREFQCTGCEDNAVRSSGQGNSTQFYNFSYYANFAISNNKFIGNIKTKLTYTTKIKNDPDEDYLLDLEEAEDVVTLPTESWYQRPVLIRVNGSRLMLETVQLEGYYPTLLAKLRSQPAIIQGLKLDCDCVNPDAIYIPASKRTENFLNAEELTITSINYQGQITIEIPDQYGNRQKFISYL
jgi:tetratricopeptide (TPR) repeat protein